MSTNWGHSSAGRAPAWHAGGQRFESAWLHSSKVLAKLLLNFEQGMQKGLINNQSSGVAACATQIISLAGLGSDSSYKNRVRKI